MRASGVSMEEKSEFGFQNAHNVAKQINSLIVQGEYFKIMSIENFYAISGRKKLADNFAKMVLLLNKLDPDRINAYNNQKLISRKSDKKFTMRDLIENALEFSTEPLGKLEPESLRNIRISGLTVYYANRLAHFAKFSREKFLFHTFDYGIKNLDKNKLGKYKSVSEKFKKYYMNYIEYEEEKARGASLETLQGIEKKKKLRRDALKQNGLSDVDILFTSEVLACLVRLERDAYAIKDVAMNDLIVQLSKQNEIPYGLKKDKEKGKELFVMDLPGYGQFSVHTKEEEIAEVKNKVKIQEYPYEVYDVVKGKIMLTNEMPYKATEIKKKCKSNKEIIKVLADVANIQGMNDAHTYAVKFGLPKKEIDILHKEIGKKRESERE